MPRTWTEEQKREQGERMRKLHEQGKVGGGRKARSRPETGDKLLDSTEEYLVKRLKDPDATPDEKDKAAAAAIRLARVPARKARRSPVRAAVKRAFVFYDLPTQAEVEAELAACKTAEERTERLLAVMGVCLEAEPDLFAPLFARALGWTVEKVMAESVELRKGAFREALRDGNVAFGTDEDEARARLDARKAGLTEPGHIDVARLREQLGDDFPEGGIQCRCWTCSPREAKA